MVQGTISISHLYFYREKKTYFIASAFQHTSAQRKKKIVIIYTNLHKMQHGRLYAF